MYQLTSLIQNTPEVYLSRSVAFISESGSRVPRDTTKGFYQIIHHWLMATALFNELSLLGVIIISQSVVWHCFSHICRARAGGYSTCDNAIVLALSLRLFKDWMKRSHPTPEGGGLSFAVTFG